MSKFAVDNLIRLTKLANLFFFIGTNVKIIVNFAAKL